MDLSTLIRRYHFFTYNVRPFRPTLVALHSWKRLLSALGLRRGFRIIDLAVTYACNLRCRHCSAMVLKQRAPQLTLDDYAEIVRQARRLDNLSWNITGGEPLLVDWLEDLIPRLEPRRHYVSIQTNCTLLDERRARLLARLGVNCITTSLDSIDPDEHNKFRGSSTSYQEVFAGLLAARRAGMGVLVGATVTHQNLRSPQLVRLIERVNRAGAMLLFNLAVPCGNWRGQNEFLLRGDDRAYLQALLRRYPRTSTDHEVGRNAVGCPAGVEKVYITPYGDVLPCPFIHVSYGNVRQTPLSGIVARMQRVKEFSEYQPICVAAENTDFHARVLRRLDQAGPPYPVDYQRLHESSGQHNPEPACVP